MSRHRFDESDHLALFTADDDTFDAYRRARIREFRVRRWYHRWRWSAGIIPGFDALLLRATAEVFADTFRDLVGGGS